MAEKPSPTASLDSEDVATCFPFRGWCRICERVGRRKGWPMGVGDALISPRGTGHHQKEDGGETTVCGLDATPDGWRWPE